MALKAIHVSDVPTRFYNDYENGNCRKCENEIQKFVVMGHRGNGMNMLQSSDMRMKLIKENSILSFKSAAKLPIDFIEFDVQVTKDDCPIIYHDNFILTQYKDSIIEKRATDLTLSEFLSFGSQKENVKPGKSLYRKIKDGRIFEWKVENDDHFCTLEDVFQNVNQSMGFNIELKFDDNLVYSEHELTRILQVILKVVFKYAKDRPIMFSSFQPDAAQMIRKLQTNYPVFFLTNGGSEVYTDVRRNSLDEAIKVCLAGDLQGIVSEVRALFRNPGEIVKIKESNLSLISYGQFNNMPEVVYVQHLMGVEGVIVDLVQEITDAVSDFVNRANEEEVESLLEEKEQDKRDIKVKSKAEFSQHKLSFLLKLIPELIQH